MFSFVKIGSSGPEGGPLGLEFPRLTFAPDMGWWGHDLFIAFVTGKITFSLLK